MAKLFLLLSVFLFASCSDFFKTNPIRTTQIYAGHYKELMDAAKSENLDEIERIVRKNNLTLNYADSAHGVSLLNWCILNERLQSFEKLLQLGANPNWQDPNGHFPPPIIEAAGISGSTPFLRSALKFGGNPNLTSSRMEGIEDQSPLNSAISSGELENVKLLIANGADVKLAPSQYCHPLTLALMIEEVEIAEYLLRENTDFENAKIKTIDGEVFGVLYQLRFLQFELGSKKHLIKMEIVDFLSSQGLDYWSYPIPEGIKKRYRDNPDYLLKY